MEAEEERDDGKRGEDARDDGGRGEDVLRRRVVADGDGGRAGQRLMASTARADGDGVAEQRGRHSTGYGLRVALLGLAVTSTSCALVVAIATVGGGAGGSDVWGCRRESGVGDFFKKQKIRMRPDLLLENVMSDAAESDATAALPRRASRNAHRGGAPRRPNRDLELCARAPAARRL